MSVEGHVLAEFRCGKLKRDGSKMTPDTRKGVLRVIQGLDELTHAVWAVRDTGVPEDDIIIFPAEAKLHKMPAPRCYALKFDGQADRNMHFWVQEPRAEDDERLIEGVNVALGNTATAVAPFSSAAAAAPTLAAHGAGSLLSPVAPTPAATSFAAPSTAPPAPARPMAPPAVTPSGAAVTPTAGNRPTLGDLQRILSTMGVPPSGGVSPGITPEQAAAALAQAMMGVSGGGGASEDAGPLLSDVLTPDVLLATLTSPEVQQRLAQYLPEEQRDAEALRELVRSPQFGSQLRAFSRALQSGAIDLAQFGLASRGTAFNVADFLAAIQRAAQEEGQQHQPAPGDDTHMQDPQQ